MADNPNDLISVDDAGKILGVVPRQVRKLITSKLLAAKLVGGTYIIRRADVAKVPSDRRPGPKPRKAK